jgi:hypothetical protein
MRIAEAVITLLIVLGLPVGAVVWAVRRKLQRRSVEAERRRVLEAPWTPREHSDGALYLFSCVKPGEEDVQVGYAALGALDFESECTLLREQQDDKLRALNGSRRSPELPEGLKVWFEYTQTMYAPKGRLLPDAWRDRRCVIAHVVDAETHEEVSCGMAVCNPVDQFVRRVGRTKALGRALGELARTGR